MKDVNDYLASIWKCSSNGCVARLFYCMLKLWTKMVLFGVCSAVSLVFFLSWTKDCQARNKPYHPRIYPPNSQINLIEDDVFLICRHTNPNITWSYPHIMGSVSSSHEVLTGTYDVTKYMYVSVLKVTKIDYTHSGYYYCSDVVNGLGNQIYVHVQGPVDAVFFDDGKGDRAVSAYLHQRFIIPCRLTNNFFVIFLWKSVPDGGDPLLVAHSDGSSQGPIRYDPQVGFVFLNALPQHNGDYFCSADWYVEWPIVSGPVTSLFSFSIKSNRLNIAPRTYITGPSDSTILIGHDLILTCEVFLDHNATLNLRWALPELTLKRKSRISQVTNITRRHDDQLFSYTSTLTVGDVSKEDEGLYYCISQMNGMHNKLTSLYINVIENTSLILLSSEAERREVFSITELEPRLEVQVLTSDQSIEVAWTRDKQVLINSPKIRVCMKEDEKGILHDTWLEFTNLSLKDAGNYTLLGSDWNVIQNTNIEIYGVHIEGIERYFPFGMGQVFFQCYGLLDNNKTSSATRNFEWHFIPCAQRGSYEEQSHYVIGSSTCRDGNLGCSNASLLMLHSGTLSCTAADISTFDRNIYSTYSAEIIVVRGNEPLFVEVVSGKRKLLAGDTLQMSCSASSYLFSQESVAWMHNGQLITVNEATGVVTRPWETELSYDLELIIQHAREDHSGSYRCAAQEIRNQNEVPSLSTVVQVEVKKSSSPRIISADLNGGIKEVEPGTGVELDCSAEGWLEPDIAWYRTTNAGEVMEEEMLNVTGSGVLRIDPVRKSDIGRYMCRATNQAGQAESFVDIVFEDYGPGISKSDLAIVLGSGAVIVLSIALSGIILGRYIYIQRKHLRELASDLELVHGSENRIDPDVPINDQPENLPFDPQWEFNRQRVTLDKKVGSGQFGVVYLAEAVGIDGSDGVVKVAAKTVRPPASIGQMRSLIAEMKMMAHVGKHLNVVSLLGACTKNLSSGSLLVLVEYCKYGNILDVLRRRREDFVDEMDPITGIVDRRGEAQLDLEGITTTTHLISWSLQVARGMGHLGSKGVVHRDLAARNVLLCSNNVVKICDFGLARDESYYKEKKGGGGLLPVKWMAIESIRDRTFSTMSDVWSYGVLLWEMFTLGEDPYPGIYIRDVYPMILANYRMSKPQLQPFFMYELMKDCWNSKPEKRPTFDHLEREIFSLLEDRVKRFYLDLNSKASDKPWTQYTRMQSSCNDPRRPNETQVSPDDLMASGSTDSSNMEAMEMKEMRGKPCSSPETNEMSW